MFDYEILENIDFGDKLSVEKNE